MLLVLYWCPCPSRQGRPGMWPRFSVWFSEPILGAVWRSKFLRVAGVLCGVVLGICECEEVIFGVLYSFVGVALMALVFQGACWWVDGFCRFGGLIYVWVVGSCWSWSVWWADEYELLEVGGLLCQLVGGWADVMWIVGAFGCWFGGVILCELCVAVSISGWLVFGWGIHGFVFAGWCWWDGMAQAVRADWVVSCVDWLWLFFCSACWERLGMWFHGFSKVVDCGDCTPFGPALGLQC